MVVQLAGALDVPLRERNALLQAAGFAPRYAERALGSEALGQVHHVLDVIVRAHGPLPAFVVDRAWTVVLSNEAARRLTSRFVEPGSPIVAGGANLLRLFLHPDGIRSFVVNWAAVATILVERLDREVAARPEDAVLQRLATELRACSGVGDLARRPRLPSASDLLVPIHLRSPGFELHLFTTIATIGSPTTSRSKSSASSRCLPLIRRAKRHCTHSPPTDRPRTRPPRPTIAAPVPAPMESARGLPLRCRLAGVAEGRLDVLEVAPGLRHGASVQRGRAGRLHVAEHLVDLDPVGASFIERDTGDLCAHVG